MTESRFGALGRIGLFALVAGLASCNSAAIKRGYMSLDNQGERRRTIFYTDTDSIYCIGELAIGRKDVTIAATFRALDFATPPKGDLVPTNTVLAVADENPGGTGDDIMATFQLIKTKDATAPWPAGKFVCELSIDGALEESIPFEIDYPECPLQPPLDGDACAGFFLPQSTCTGAITAETCVCSDGGAWQCH